jgi:hypothetical protein
MKRDLRFGKFKDADGKDVNASAGVEFSRQRRSAERLARLIAPAEEDVAQGRVMPARVFLKEFKRARGI